MTLQAYYSNNADLPTCDVGIYCENIKAVDDVEVHTGDIVIVWVGHHISTDDECWYPSESLTTIFIEQFGHFSIHEDKTPYVMFWKNADFTKDYKVQVVKKYTDLVPNEHWTFKGGCEIYYK